MCLASLHQQVENDQRRFNGGACHDVLRGSACALEAISGLRLNPAFLPIVCGFFVLLHVMVGISVLVEIAPVGYILLRH